MPIVATPGDPTANSFGTLAEANIYFGKRRPIPTAWFDEIQSLNKENALLQGADDVNTRIGYIGDIATDTQSMKWPRIINDTYKWIADVFPFADNEVPVKVKEAQFEWALIHLVTTTAVAAGTVDSMEIGDDVKIKYASGSSATAVDTSVDPWGVPMTVARKVMGIRSFGLMA